MKKKVLIACLLSTALSASLLFGCRSGSVTETQEPATTKAVAETEKVTEPATEFTATETEVKNTITYDKLQTLFLTIDESTKLSDVESLAEQSDLFYTEETYSGNQTCIQVAYTEGASLQKYSDSGDYLKVIYDEYMSFEYMQYCKETSAQSALYYQYGDFFDFSEDEPGEYSGCYIVDPFGKNEGITITYTNGNTKKTNYFLHDSKEALLSKIMFKN